MRIRGKLDYSYYIDNFDFDSSMLYILFSIILSHYQTITRFLTLKIRNKNNHAFFSHWKIFFLLRFKFDTYFFQNYKN